MVSSPLKPLANLGLSGSAFFHTAGPSSNAGLIIKSINRAFEYEFLHETLLPAYVAYLEKTNGASSLLSRVTDVLWNADRSLGNFLRIRPKHYMILVDILGDLSTIEGAKKWDLKPSGFFEVCLQSSCAACVYPNLANFRLIYSPHEIWFPTLSNQKPPKQA